VIASFLLTIPTNLIITFLPDVGNIFSTTTITMANLILPVYSTNSPRSSPTAASGASRSTSLLCSIVGIFVLVRLFLDPRVIKAMAFNDAVDQMISETSIITVFVSDNMMGPTKMAAEENAVMLVIQDELQQSGSMSQVWKEETTTTTQESFSSEEYEDDLIDSATL
jgi:hypothetical protein